MRASSKACGLEAIRHFGRCTQLCWWLYIHIAEPLYAKMKLLMMGGIAVWRILHYYIRLKSHVSTGVHLVRWEAVAMLRDSISKCALQCTDFPW